MGYRIRDGVWVHEDHFYQNNGYIKDDRGKQRLPASMRMSDFREGSHQRTKGYSVDIRSALRKYKRRNDIAALEEIRTMTHPAAIEGVETLGQIESSTAQNQLVVIAMACDPNDPAARELSEECVRLLRQPHFSQAGVVQTVMPFLRPKPQTPNYQEQRASLHNFDRKTIF